MREPHRIKFDLKDEKIDIHMKSGLGVTLDREFIKHFSAG